jgi:hypothetical protein
LVRLNAPFTAVVVLTSGDPDTVDAQLSQETPGVNAWTGAFGTYTRMFGSGSTWFGAYTVPVSVVVTPVTAQVCCWRQRPVHVTPELALLDDAELLALDELVEDVVLLVEVVVEEDVEDDALEDDAAVELLVAEALLVLDEEVVDEAEEAVEAESFDDVLPDELLTPPVLVESPSV